MSHIAKQLPIVSFAGTTPLSNGIIGWDSFQLGNETDEIKMAEGGRQYWMSIMTVDIIYFVFSCPHVGPQINYIVVSQKNIILYDIIHVAYTGLI